MDNPREIRPQSMAWHSTAHQNLFVLVKYTILPLIKFYLQLDTNNLTRV
jgi:hypothetical protein